MNKYDAAAEALDRIQKRVKLAAQKAQRHPASITLVGASKKQSIALLQAFSNAGLQDMGENYLQEALSKQRELTKHKINWHFIGHVQSNKTKPIAENFSWVHGVEKLKHAQRLGAHKTQLSRIQHSQPINLNVLVQVNIDSEPSKNGVSVSETPTLCAQIAEIEGVSIRGLMLIPKARTNVDEQHTVFARARKLLEQTNQRYGLTMDSLSMGMSADFEAAIAEGSTMIRIGTDLFGSRS